MIEEILGTGLDSVELGYDLTIDLLPGVRDMVKDGAVKVISLHNYCPVPVGAPRGHPELFLFTSPDPKGRESAIRHTTRTVELAAELGARVIVVHAGNVEMRRYSRKLADLCRDGRQYDARYERIKAKLLQQRDKKAQKHLDRVSECVEQMLPALEEHGISMALENLPTWEAVPTETEAETLCQRFNSPFLRCWYDLGHGQIRQNLGLISQHRWLERLRPWIAGMHLHDVNGPDQDHIMPPDGQIDFLALASLVDLQWPLVFEPSPSLPLETVREGIRIVRQAWECPPSPQETGEAS